MKLLSVFLSSWAALSRLLSSSLLVLGLARAYKYDLYYPKVSICSWWPRTVLVYTCHSDMIISGRDSMGSQKCLGLDVKLCVTQTLLSISKPLLIISRAHLFLSIPTNALLNQDHFNSCIQPHQFPVPHHRILTFQLVKLSQLSLK